MSDVENAKTIAAVAANLGVPAVWLDAIIRNESGYDPKAKNPSSSARGLIQFVDATARDLGFRDSKDLVDSNPEFSRQMFGPVFLYFKRWGPHPSLYHMGMSCFLPAYRKQSPQQRLPQWAIDANNGRFKTGEDYIALLEGRIAEGKLLTQRYAEQIETAIAQGKLPRPPAAPSRKGGGTIALAAVLIVAGIVLTQRG